MGAWFDPNGFDWGFIDLFRVLIVCGAIMLIGANTAFWIHAPRIFPETNIKIWRIFFIGKSLITGSMAMLIWARIQDDLGLSNAAWIGMLGIVISNIALFLLYRSGRTTIVIAGGDEDATKNI